MPSASTRGRITRVDAPNGDPLLVAGVRSALLWGSSPTQIDSTVPNPFAGYQQFIIRFLATGEGPKPRSDREIVVRPEKGHQSHETNLPSAHAWDTTGKQPVLDTAQLRLSVHYPEQALRLGIGGATYISAYFGPDGRVGDAFAEMSDHPLFTDAAITAIRATKFTPAIGLDGKPKGAWLTIPIFFSPN